MLDYAMSAVGWMLVSFYSPAFENFAFTCYNILVASELYMIYAMFKKEKQSSRINNIEHLPSVIVWGDNWIHQRIYYIYI